MKPQYLFILTLISVLIVSSLGTAQPSKERHSARGVSVVARAAHETECGFGEIEVTANEIATASSGRPVLEAEVSVVYSFYDFCEQVASYGAATSPLSDSLDMEHASFSFDFKFDRIRDTDPWEDGWVGTGTVEGSVTLIGVGEVRHANSVYQENDGHIHYAEWVRDAEAQWTVTIDASPVELVNATAHFRTFMDRALWSTRE